MNAGKIRTRKNSINRHFSHKVYEEHLYLDLVFLALGPPSKNPGLVKP